MSLTLHPEHGVNPTMEVCWICQEETGAILLLGANRGKQAERYTCAGNLCDDCQQKIAEGGVFILEALSPNGKSPERTGRYVCINKDALNVQAPKGVAFMLKNEFEKLFGEAFNV